jgi:hypothetical protein
MQISGYKAITWYEKGMKALASYVSKETEEKYENPQAV